MPTLSGMSSSSTVGEEIQFNYTKGWGRFAENHRKRMFNHLSSKLNSNGHLVPSPLSVEGLDDRLGMTEPSSTSVLEHNVKQSVKGSRG